jgi:hypothetical protein
VNQVTLGAISGSGYGSVVTLFDIPAALKTSNGRAISATLSMEAALWTYNLTNAIVNGGKASSSSRAAIKAWIEVDGVAMEPGNKAEGLCRNDRSALLFDKLNSPDFGHDDSSFGCGIVRITARCRLYIVSF